MSKLMKRYTSIQYTRTYKPKIILAPFECHLEHFIRPKSFLKLLMILSHIVRAYV